MCFDILGNTWVFDPRLEVNAAHFAEQWREHPENHALGSFAVADSSGPQTFGEPGTVLTFLGGVAVGVLPNALWDGIKWTYARLCASQGKPAREVEMQHFKQPDGMEITVIRIKE